MSPLAQFDHLSQLLTGFTDLPEAIATGYYQKLVSAEGYKDHLPGLLELAAPLSSAHELMQQASAEQKLCCRAIVFLWYAAELVSWASLPSGVLDPARQPATEEEYYSGLIWPAIRAHPLALSGGYYGYWKYEPEN